MKKHYFFLILTLSIFATINSFGQKNPDLSPTPPMGWNSWNYFGKHDINEKLVYEVIDAIVEHGLKDVGYNYIVIDGGWRDVKLSPEGKLLAHPSKFPNGIKPLADYAHSKGLKFGLHTVPGTHDCGGDAVGGYNREEIHIQQFVDWGLDFVKVDLCKMTEDPCETCTKSQTGWSEQTLLETYTKWSNLLNNCGRDILFNISAYTFRDWNPDLCNMSRTTYDIKSNRQKEGAAFNSESRENRGFLSVMTCAEINNKYAKYAGNGYWNDPDMLVTGNRGINDKEQESHFALWSIISSPLMLGNDPRNMSEAEKKLVLNKEIIAVNQDPREQGILYKNVDNTQIWKKSLSNGDIAILLLNLDPSIARKIEVNFTELGLSGKLKGRDLINQKKINPGKIVFSKVLEPHECFFFTVRGK